MLPKRNNVNQEVLLDIVGSKNTNSIWGSGDGLPVRNKTLESGGGLIKSGDTFGETGNMFGLRRRGVI